MSKLMTESEKSLIAKFKKIASIVETEQGPLSFYGVFKREGSAKWDLLVAAPWVDTDRRGALDYLADLVVKRLSARERLELSGIVLLESQHPDLKAFNQHVVSSEELQSELTVKGRITIDDRSIFGLDIQEAVIFVSRNLGNGAKKAMIAAG